MNVKVILFPRGGGGNFLGRIFSLDTKTVPLGSDDSILDNVKLRAEKYNYEKIINAISGSFNKSNPNGFSSWGEIERTILHFPLTLGIEQLIALNRIIVEPMHPEHFHAKKDLFGTDDQLSIFYLNSAKCEDWVIEQIKHKIGNFACKLDREEIDFTHRLGKELSGKEISLFNILNSEKSFLDEYHKISSEMELQTYDTHALDIYRSWKNTWAQ